MSPVVSTVLINLSSIMLVDSDKSIFLQVYVLLKNTIETERHIENPPIIVADPDVEISGTLAACASFLAKGLEAEMQARAAKNVDV